ncbi:MAG: AAA family ATPase [Azoarcus sp.]|jgi:type II secretory pathway predicted ATPase ExeA|nr:AAA family ATPase [Azoarcus sp.]
MKQTLAALGVGQREFARAVELTARTARRLLNEGIWPARDPAARGRVEAFLAEKMRSAGYAPQRNPVRGFAPHLPRPAADFEPAPSGENEAGRIRDSEPAPGETPPATDADEGALDEEQQMLIRKCTLTPAARKYWGLFGAALSAPWERDQVFLNHEFRVIYEHMLAKARHGGMLGVVGESGAGKTTIKDTLVGDLAAEGEIDVIEPRIQRMEADDKRGKTLKTADIVEAIMAEIAPGEKIRVTSEAQLRQVAAALAGRLSENQRRRVLVVFDEAHCIPKTTLRHLKRLLELKDPARKGLQRPLMSILLIGQPELAVRLSPRDPDVREIWQRCEIVHLPPLGGALEPYIRHRLGDEAVVRIFAPDAVARLAAALTDRNGTSYLHPLAVDNWLAELLNRAAGLAKQIDGALVDEIVSDVRRRA